LRSSLAALPPDEREGRLATLTREELELLAASWGWWARDDQLEPLDRIEAPRPFGAWYVLSGRGWGKTRTGAAATIAAKDRTPYLALIGRTAADATEVMVEGPAGILEHSPPWDRPRFVQSALRPRLEWKNGAKAFLYSSKNPESLRGPQHGFYWADELAAWYYLDDTFDMLQFGLRVGAHPWGVVTTTPKPLPHLRAVLQRAEPVEGFPRLLYTPDNGGAYVTKGHTADNAANLPAKFLADLDAKYAGTRLGRQELEGELLDDVEGALWTRALIERGRVRKADAPKSYDRIVVAVDPLGSKGSGTAGIIVAGVVGKGRARDFYPLEDLSGSYSPAEWGRIVIAAHDRWSADLIVAERNFGGDMVEHVIRTAAESDAYRVKVTTSTRGKVLRAEPVVALYEQGRAHHVGGFAELEDEMTTWVVESGLSPNRIDALVFAALELAVLGRVSSVGQTQGSAVG